MYSKLLDILSIDSEASEHSEGYIGSNCKRVFLQYIDNSDEQAVTGVLFINGCPTANKIHHKKRLVKEISSSLM